MTSREQKLRTMEWRILLSLLFILACLLAWAAEANDDTQTDTIFELSREEVPRHCWTIDRVIYQGPDVVGRKLTQDGAEVVSYQIYCDYEPVLLQTYISGRDKLPEDQAREIRRIEDDYGIHLEIGPLCLTREECLDVATASCEAQGSPGWVEVNYDPAENEQGAKCWGKCEDAPGFAAYCGRPTPRPEE